MVRHLLAMSSQLDSWSVSISIERQLRLALRDDRQRCSGGLGMPRRRLRQADPVLHLAAESHVDRSISGPDASNEWHLPLQAVGCTGREYRLS